VKKQSSRVHVDFLLQSYRARLRERLEADLETKTSLELSQAVPPTEVLNSDAQKGRAELARQGSLADRSLPTHLSGTSVGAGSNNKRKSAGNPAAATDSGSDSVRSRHRVFIALSSHALALDATHNKSRSPSLSKEGAGRVLPFEI
jgi:hypothetical protein